MRERAAAGVVLGKLGDPRKGVGLDQYGLPDLDWVEIKPGKFKMGGKESWEGGQEFPCKLIKKPYRISRYPVTVAQFQAFVKAGGYKESGRKWWTRDGWTWRERNRITGPEEYRDIFQTPNHPQVGVSWYEAIAFCRWLTECWRRNKLLGKNECITLPSEPEWERAARGTGGKLYPWGKVAENIGEKCNCWESGLGATSAVGMFPTGKSEDGVRDLVGNVWEWCRSLWGKDWYQADFGYPYQAVDGREDFEAPETMCRVFRGASWGHGGPVDLLSSLRNDDLPDVRGDGLGFRVVWVGVSVWKVLFRKRKQMGEMRRGSTACAVSAKKPPNRPPHAPHGEKTRRRAVAGNGCPQGNVRESHGPLFGLTQRPSRRDPRE